MKKFLLIFLFFSFFSGISQEKKIYFDKEIDYKVIDKNKSDGFLKTYTGKNGEFLTKMALKNLPVYFFTDRIGTSAVDLVMNNRLESSDLLISSLYYGFSGYSRDKTDYYLESKKLDTRETLLGISCSHYLLTLKRKDRDEGKESFKVCIDDHSAYNNIPVLSGLISFFDKSIKLKSSGVKGLILKGGPEKTYDTEYFVATSIKDSKDFVYFDHLKTMMSQQRKQDSIMLAQQRQEEEYSNMKTDSVVYADSAFVDIDTAAAFADPVPDTHVDSYMPDYVSEYKNVQSGPSDLAIHNVNNKNLLKGIPKHCKNFETELPSFGNKELGGHLKNYVGQICDLYLTQADNHSVGIKITLDEIRREVLYLNEIQGKLDQSDKKKLNTYLKNLD